MVKVRGPKGPKLSFQIENKIITLNLHHFVSHFLTACNVLRVPVISVALSCLSLNCREEAFSGRTVDRRFDLQMAMFPWSFF